MISFVVGNSDLYSEIKTFIS